MADYVKLSLPRAEMRRLLSLAAAGAYARHEDGVDGEIQASDVRLVARLTTALQGKDLRATNQHNTPRAKGDTKTADEMLRQARRKWS